MRFNELVAAYDGARRERNVYHDLMRSRVREVLLVASLFDSFVIESDGILNEQVYGEYYKLNLTSVPRVTSAYTEESAMRLFAEGRFDLVILMAGLDYERPLSLARRMKSEWPAVQILLLATSNGSLESLDKGRPELACVDRIFVWNGYSKLFVGMLKYVEDLRNVEADTRIGLVRVILLIEPSVRWYSRYLPILYRTVMRQTQALIEEESAVETYKLLHARGRPKILLAASYEEAAAIFERFEPYIVAVISELGFPRGGSDDPGAGADFITMAKARNPDLPVIVQSGGEAAAAAAASMGAAFADKGSESVERELCDFLVESLRFGPFLFKSEAGAVVASAGGIEEMVRLLESLPLDCVLRHARLNDYSTWLIARGEVRMARVLRGYRLDDFASPEDIRDFLVRTLERARREKSRGMLPYFDERTGRESGSMTRLGDGSVGGKGRGILFLNQVLEGVDFGRAFGGRLDVKLPRSSFVGIDSFERFLESNGLWSFAFYEAGGEGGGERVRERFLSSPLDPALRERLRRFASLVAAPLAVRSSGLFEDMILVPFAGAYDTYVLPNSHPDPEVRLAQLEAAVKLVYASLFSARARSRFEATGYALEEERMAVVVQELVGSRRGRWFYPHASGSAQSCNYYPLAYARPEDGICVAALGLGAGALEGESAFRFCPRYPTLESAPPKRLLEGGQRTFKALDMDLPEPDLTRGPDAALADVDLSEAELDPRFGMLASTWDAENDRLTPGVGTAGPRVVDFGNILKYEALPLAQAVSMVLDIGERAMGAAVEIEYALNLDESGGTAALYLLQMRPLVRSDEPSEEELDAAAGGDCFIVSPRSMGNGRDLSVADVVWVDPRTFDRAATEAMAAEIGELDAEMRALGRRYLLVGPGRWGTRDRWLGVPVAFSQISMARAIVEADIPGLSVESSMGSHFFHNVTGMRIGYLTVPLEGEGRIDWEWLYSLEAERRTAHCARTRLPEPLGLLMDGRRSRAVVLKSARAGLCGCDPRPGGAAPKD
jgi:hypothetical protein